MMPGHFKIKTRTATFVTMILGALCAFTVSAHAETIYRSISMDGEVTYSSQPVPGAREYKAIEMESLSPEQRRAGLLLLQQEKSLSAKVDAQLQLREKEWRLADREIIAAQNGLANAESALQNGRAPLPGERSANVGGGSRLTEAYFQRIRSMEARVEQAKQRLDQAYAARNALK